ncbi:MAG: hypothetical protein ACRCXK_07040 [Wohlfahrtiimonas sp.]
MADERLNSIEKKHASFEQWVWKTISGLGLAAVIWYLNGINTSLKTLSDDIVAIKLSDSANNVRMNRIEDDVTNLKSNDKEHSKRLSELEKSSAQHGQQLKQLSK